MSAEAWKTLRAYRKWLGWIAVFATLVLNLNNGWITMADIQTLVREAVNVIQALVPGGVTP